MLTSHSSSNINTITTTNTNQNSNSVGSGGNSSSNSSSSSSSIGGTLIVKCLLIINIIMYVAELIWPDLIFKEGLMPSLIYEGGGGGGGNNNNNWTRLFMHNFLHLPLNSRTGPMGVFHILLNMITLWNIGMFLEKKMGTFALLGMTIVFVATIGPLMIPLAYFLRIFGSFLDYSHSLSIGFSGVLFAYFMVYLKLTPGETSSFMGAQVAKWWLPFLNLILLSFLVNASLIGHLSGIIIGAIYVTGFPGFFYTRQNILKQLDNWKGWKSYLTNRYDFCPASQQPCFDHFSLSFTSNNRSPQGTTYTTVPLGHDILVETMINGPRRNNTMGNTNVQMTVKNGVLVPKS